MTLSIVDSTSNSTHLTLFIFFSDRTNFEGKYVRSRTITVENIQKYFTPGSKLKMKQRTVVTRCAADARFATCNVQCAGVRVAGSGFGAVFILFSTGLIAFF